MSKDINLCKILRGHEEEVLYCSEIDAIVTLKEVNNNTIVIEDINGDFYEIFPNGGIWSNSKRIALFPSKEQRDWNKWIEDNNTDNNPKTWIDLELSLGNKKEKEWVLSSNLSTDIEKSALALLKIYKLIGVGYGGNITDEEWRTAGIDKFIIRCERFVNGVEYKIEEVCVNVHAIAFHTPKQAEEFLSYPENVQLLKDYFMIE